MLYNISMIKKFFFVLTFSAATLSCPFIWEEITGEFRFGKLACQLPYNPARRAASVPLVREMRSTTPLGNCLTSAWRNR